jgi:hypothetical protein
LGAQRRLCRDRCGALESGVSTRPLEGQQRTRQANGISPERNIMLTVILGRAFSVEPIALVLRDHPPEFDRDTIFRACNRIEDARQDCVSLPAWARHLRRGLDVGRAPSMSVGDDIVVTSSTGQHVSHMRCEPIGWSAQPAGRAIDTVLVGTKVIHLD